MAVPAMTDLDLFLTGSSRAGRPCHCPFVAWLISFRPSGARGSLARGERLLRTPGTEPTWPTRPGRGQPDLFTQDL